jgi:hypothetical protein
MTRLSQDKLELLRASTPHCATDELPTDYAANFAEPLLEQKCLYCGESYTFTWGLTHGEGHCTECGWPARLYHFIKDESGNETRVVKLLQVHPDAIDADKVN